MPDLSCAPKTRERHRQPTRGGRRISESLASQHLKVLLNAGLVDRLKDGKKVYYTVNHADPLVDALKNVVEA